jgi:hypothetical protein
MVDFPADIYTEPDADVDTLKNLGPLTGMAGIWTSAGGEDVHRTAAGPEEQAFIERYELQPIDPQTNGPQLLYGLRYHTHIVKPDSVETFHDQVEDVQPRGRPWLGDQWDRFQSVPGARVQDAAAHD